MKKLKAAEEEKIENTHYDDVVIKVATPRKVFKENEG